MARPRTPEKYRFWSKVEKTADGCWLWRGEIGRRGYGLIGVGYKKRYAHRVSYEMHYGEIPRGLLVCHTCDNKPCVRPDHLFSGTAGDNARDASIKGRLFGSKGKCAGERSPLAKLTWAAVAAIRSSETPSSELADRYGVDRSLIYRVRKGRVWRERPRS